MGNRYSWIAESSAMDPIPMEDLIAMSMIERKEGHGKNNCIIRGVSGIISFLSSFALIWMIARSHKGLSTTQHRILLGLSICDIMSSLSYSTFGFMAPSDNDYSVWNARGNVATCDAQGVFFAFGATGGIFYNAALNVYSLTVVKFDKNEDYVRTKVEPFLHGVPITWALTFSIVSLAGEHLNDDGTGYCSVPVHYPLHCQGYDVGEIRDGFEIPCGRGIEGVERFRFFGPISVFIAAIIVITSLVMIYRAVKKQEMKLSRYGASTLTSINSPQLQGRVSLWKRIKTTLSRSSAPASSSNVSRPAIRSNNMQSQSRAVMHKAFQYSFAWLLSFVPFFIVVFFGFSVVTYYFMSILLPLQGFYNLCIYMYPKVISARKVRRGEENKVSWRKAISEAFWSRGKERKQKNCPRNQRTSNLRGNRNPLHNKKNRNGIIRYHQDNTTNITSTATTDEKSHRRESREEEEEKCEIQPPSNSMVPTRRNVLDLTYAPNPTPPITGTHRDIELEVTDIVEDAASETSEGGDGKEEVLGELDDNSEDESITNEAIYSEGKDADIIKVKDEGIDGKEQFVAELDDNSIDESFIDEDFSYYDRNDVAITTIEDERKDVMTSNT